METLAELKKKRTQYMHRLYELSEGDEHKIFDMFLIGEELGFGQRPSELTDKIVQYLRGEGLIEFHAIGGIIGITHGGIKEVEQSLEEPEEPTEHFAPLATVNIVHVNSMVNSNIQQSGAGSMQTLTISATQVANLKEIIDELKAIIEKERLTPDQKEELNTEVEVLALEAKSSKPKASRIKDSLTTAQTILTVASVGLAVATRIGVLLAGMQ